MRNPYVKLLLPLLGAGMVLASSPAFAEEGASLAWTAVTDEETGVEYYTVDAVYAETPVLASSQFLRIYTPASYLVVGEDGTASVNPEGAVESSTGLTYTAENAPVLIHNTSSANGK